MQKRKHWLMTIAVLLSSLAANAAIIASGKDGYFNWKITAAGELILEGEGRMYNYDIYGTPWHDYKEAITTITIGEGITYIGENAFNGCYNCSTIVIPGSINDIGEYAFNSCGKNQSVYANNLEDWCDINFDGCYSNPLHNGGRLYLEGKLVTSLEIPSKGIRLKEHVFEGCSSITGLIINHGITSIGEDAFFKCSNLSSISVPSSVTEVGQAAFHGTAWYNNLPNGVVYLGETLYDCIGMEYITSIDIREGIKLINNYTFSGCSNLTSITIPNSVIKIGAGAFNGCNKLREVIFEDGDNNLYLEMNDVNENEGLFYGNSSLETVYIGRNLTWNYTAFENLTNLTSVTIGKNVTSIDSYAFFNCKKLATIICKASIPPTCRDDVFYGVDKNTPLYVPEASLKSYQTASTWNSFTNIQPIPRFIKSGTCGNTSTWGLTEDGELIIEGEGEMADYYDGNQPWCEHIHSITKIAICEGVTRIGQCSFKGCEYVTSITIPESVTTIGDYAFSKCTALSDITINCGVTRIGNYAFQSCAIKDIRIPNSVVNIGDFAFTSCSSLKNVFFEDGTENIYLGDCKYEDGNGGGLFEYLNIETIHVGRNIVLNQTGLIYGPFKHWRSNYDAKLKSATIGPKVTQIPSQMFDDCPELTHIYFKSNPLIAATDAIPSTATCHLTLDDADNVDFNTANANTYADATYTRAINASKYGTIMLPFAPDAESLENFAFFALSSNNGEYLIFDEVAEPQANTPYLYTLREGKEATQITGGQTTISSVISTPEVDGWKAIGSFTNQTIMTEYADVYYYAYTSADNQLHRVTKKLNVKPYRAFFTANGAQPTQLAIRTRGGDVTIIDAAEVEDLTPAVYYDLSGRRVDNPTKGVYIVNGKKVIL